jgi:DUF218 domain
MFAVAAIIAAAVVLAIPAAAVRLSFRRAYGGPRPPRLSILFAATLSLAATTPALAQDPQGYTAPFPESLESRVFPLFSLIRAAPGWAEAIATDPELRLLARQRTARVPATDCTAPLRCLTDAWTWTEGDIAKVEARLRALARQPRLRLSLVHAQMRRSGRFARHAALPDGDLLSSAWKETALGLNRVIAVYALGEPPRYPVIDAIIFDTAHPEYAGILRRHGVATAAMSQAGDLIFDPALRYATGLLMINERTEAAAFRPLLAGENSASVQAASTIDWQQYRYPALLVFGHGPEDPQSGTGPMAHIRLRLAADMFAKRMAPFVVVSGGNVHPNRTKSNEAVEMKRLLVSLHGIPADRILIEPHARHTTTNLRNSARLLLAAGFPVDRPSLIVSDHITMRYITGTELAARNLREMSVQPGKVEAGPDQFTALFTPHPVAFHVEVTDPLDP